MSKKAVLLFRLIIGVLLLIVVTACYAKSNKTYLVMGEINFPPYSYFQNGIPTGLCVDLIKEIAKKKKIDIKIRLDDWHIVKEDLEAKKIDIVMGMIFTPDRDITCDFSMPYLSLVYDVVTKKGVTCNSFNELKKGRVGIQRSDYISTILEQNQVDKFSYKNTVMELLSALGNGEYDYVVIPKMQAYYLSKMEQFHFMYLNDVDILVDNYCMAVPTNDWTTLNLLNEGLAELKADGTYQRLYEKWLGKSNNEKLVYQFHSNYSYMIIMIIFIFLSVIIITVFTKVISHKTKELQDSEERYKSLIENASSGIIILENKNIIYMNEHARIILNIPSTKSINPSFSDLVAVNDQTLFDFSEQHLQKNPEQPQSFHLHVRTYNGLAKLLNVTLSVIIWEGAQHILLIFNDITEQRRIEQENKMMEEQLRHAQKMDSIGKLAGAVAHEFNNLLTPIIGYANMAQIHIPEDTPLYNKINHIIEAGIRSREVIQQLLLFSQKNAASLQTISLARCIDTFLYILKSVLNDNITLKIEIPQECPYIKADQGLIEQLLMNLILNANDAMPNGGELTVRLKAVDIVDKEKLYSSTLEVGSYLLLIVKDTGSGISKEMLEHIYKPFSTTMNFQSGLGLSTVYAIIQQHKGELSIDSDTREGTTFNIYFPVTVDKPDTSNDTSGNLALLPFKIDAEIVVVDNNDSVKDLIKAILESVNLQCHTFNDPLLAMSWAFAQEKAIDLLITDLVMPNMSGNDLIKQFRNKFPQLPIIAISGYTDTSQLIDAELQQRVAFIRKPFVVSNFIYIVRQLLLNEPESKV